MGKEPVNPIRFVDKCNCDCEGECGGQSCKCKHTNSDKDDRKDLEFYGHYGDEDYDEDDEEGDEDNDEDEERTPGISQYHINNMERMGCDDWDEYCNLMGISYCDLLDD